MDSKPVRVVFLTEREDEATQCRVQGYRFAHGNAVSVLTINCQDTILVCTVLANITTNDIYSGGKEMRNDLTGNL